MDRSNVIEALRERLAAYQPASRAGAVQTVAGPLALGAVHEWCGGEAGAGWMPALCVLAGVARSLGEGVVVWVGKRCRPHPCVLTGRCERGPGESLLARSILVEAPDGPSRLWAMETALRSACVVAVIGDACAMDIACTRRLQLAAESTGAIAMLARPRAEARVLSSATTRRLVIPAVGQGADARPRWRIELVRSRGTCGDALMVTSRDRWCVEWDHGTGALVALSGVEHGSGASAAEACERRRGA